MRLIALAGVLMFLCVIPAMTRAEVIPAPCGEEVPCEGASVTTAAPLQIDELSYEAFQALRNSGEDFLLLDTRPLATCQSGHIPKAECFPLRDINPSSVEKLPKDKLIVVYCQSAGCHVSHLAAVKLKEFGYDVKDYKGGVIEWSTKGQALEEDAAQTLPLTP